MKSNSFLRKMFFGASERRIVSRKRMTTAYVSLFLICTLFISGTLSWFTSKDMTSLGSDLLKMSSSTGLSINQGESLTNKIIIKDFKLSEASSVDGRNMFFPITGSPTGTIDSRTANMLFREGNAGDKDVLYACKDITIVGVTDPTNIYVKSYSVVLKDKAGKVLETFDGTTQIEDTNDDGVYDKQVTHQKCPIRIAFIDDSQDTPRVFDPTAIIQEHVDDYDAVSYIDDIGSAATNRTHNQSFSDYIFSDGGTPLFQISHSDSIDLSMVIWLEGTGENMDRYADGSVSVEVELESNFSNMVPVKFVDETSNDDDNSKSTVTSWIQGKGEDSCIVTMAYKDSDGATKTVVMKKLSGTTYPTWTAMLPSDITTEISFYRFSVSDETIYNSWHTTTNEKMSKLYSVAQGWLTNVFQKDKLETSRVLSNGAKSLVYTARCGNGYGYVEENDSKRDEKRLSPCIGFWDQTTAAKGLTGTPGGGGSQDDSGGTEGGTAGIAVTLNVTKDWVKQNLGEGYVPYVELDNGKTYQMSVNSNHDYCSLSQTQMEVGKYITYITLKKGDSTKKLSLSIPQVISTNWNYNYKIANDDKIIPN